MSDAAKTSSPRAHVLVVEDSSVFREMQGLLLGQAGYAVSGHEHPQAALAAARQRKFDLVIIDYELPEMNGQQFMNELRKILPDIAVIFVSGSLTLELAIQLSRQGVAGIFNKPANPKTLLEKINETLSRTGSRDAALPGKGSSAPLPAARRGSSNPPFVPAPTGPIVPVAGEVAYTPRYFLGRCDAFCDFSHRLWKVRDFRAVLLLQGEQGTPFELVARDLVAISIFRDGPVMVCDAAKFDTPHLIEILAPTLLSQDAGTLIISGVELLTAAQQKVLQTLMTSRDVFLPFARRFRLVLAAAAHLSDLADAGRLDETLFYKISSLTVDVPALRELSGDILLHTRQLLDQHAAATEAAKSPSLSTDAALWLEAQEWAGNYTELSRLLHHAVAKLTGPELDVPALEAAFEIVAAEAELAPKPVVVSRSRPPFAVEQTQPPFAMRTAPPPAAPVVTAPNVVPAAPAIIAVTPAHVPSKPSSLSARSIFRPPSSAYDFSKRLTESLAAAESATSR